MCRARSDFAREWSRLKSRPELAAGIVSYDQTVLRGGPIRRALTPFTDHRSFRTRPLAGSTTTDEIVPPLTALGVGLTARAGIDVGVHANPTDITSPQSTGIESRAVDVDCASLG